jgi:hypothetical protein
MARITLLNVGGTYNRTSTTIHVVRVTNLLGSKGTWVRAACDRPTEVLGYEIDSQHGNVCKRCRKAMGWGNQN